MRATFQKEKILILVKTYPTPSSKYVETVCVAGITANGEFLRLYPVPFRSMSGNKQFKKWQWLEAKIKSATFTKTKDYRTESHRIDIESINLLTEIDTSKSWTERMNILSPLVSPSFCELLSKYDENLLGKYPHTLAVIKPREAVFEIRETDKEWTQEQKEKLNREQETLFGETPRKSDLEKIPFEFRYSFKCMDSNCQGHNLMITDWETGMLYRNCFQKYGENWKEKVLHKYNVEFNHRDLHLIVGNMKQYPKNWLVVGVLAPPLVEGRQLPLFGY